MSNNGNKFLPIFQILYIKNVSFLLKLEMALATTIRMKFEPVCAKLEIVIKELRQLRMSADFFANTSHDISRYPGVHSVPYQGRSFYGV